MIEVTVKLGLQATKGLAGQQSIFYIQIPGYEESHNSQLHIINTIVITELTSKQQQQNKLRCHYIWNKTKQFFFWKSHV